ncbi:AMP-binding protein, partial [Pseudomonas aeruginosa]|nr:AMP-binding protein [Pseudomonas aeruginosa]
AELNRRANRLAHALIERGVGADRLVGVAMERSIEMVVALMAILKAGGAYGADLRDRPVRGADRRAHGAALAEPAARHAGEPAGQRRLAADARCRGAWPVAGRLERHCGRVPAATRRAPVVRGAGRAHADGAGAGLRRGAPGLRRAEPPGQPPGACPDRAR